MRETAGEAEGKRGFSGVEREGHTGVRSGSLSLAAFQSLCVQRRLVFTLTFQIFTPPHTPPFPSLTHTHME